MKLSDNELQIVSFLQSRSDAVSVGDLFQFSKPGTKPKSVQKKYTDLVLKFKNEGIPVPWTCQVSTSLKDYPETKPEQTVTEPQRLVQIQFARKEPEQSAVQRDYRLDRNCMAIISKQDGKIVISNYEDWYVIKHLFENHHRRILLEEFKDVLWPQAGSKLPARWMDAVLRRIQNLRRAIPSLKKRLLTVPNLDAGTFFIFE